MKMEECINYLLTGAQHRVFQEMKNELKIYDLTPIQYGVLKCIWEKKLSNPKEIAVQLGIENSTISGILERMESKGFVFREIDPDDRRYIKVTLSDKAKELEKPVNATVLKVNENVLKGYTEEEVVQFKKYLKKMME